MGLKNNSSKNSETARIEVLLESFELRLNLLLESIELKIKDTNTRLNNLETLTTDLKDSFENVEGKFSDLSFNSESAEHSSVPDISTEINQIHNDIFELHSEIEQLENYLPYQHFFTYQDVSDGVELTGFYPVSSVTDIRVPPAINGKSVVSIGDYAFLNSDVGIIYLPDTIKRIGNSAFKDCNSLYDILLSNNLAEIGEHAFDGCNNLTSVELPKSLNTLGSYAFANSGIEEIEILSNVLEISPDCFFNCQQLSEVVLNCKDNCPLYDYFKSYEVKIQTLEN